MTFKKFLIGTLIGGLTAFFVGFLLYGIAFSDFFTNQIGSATNLRKDPFSFLPIIFGDLTFASLLTYLFGYFGAVRNFKSGAIAGATIGFLTIFAINMFAYANMNVYSLAGHFTDAVLEGITGALAGGAIGWYLGRDEKAAASEAMPMNRFLIATAIGTVATFVGGFLFYGFVFSETIAANTGGVTDNIKAEPDMPFMMLANIAVGALMAYVLGRWASMRSLWSGAVVGGIVGFLSCFAQNAWQHAQFNLLTVKGIYIDAIVYGLMAAVTGAAVAWYLNRSESAA